MHGIISNTIQIYDRVSSPISNMINALDSMCSAYENVDNAMRDGLNISHIENARNSINAAAQSVVELGNNIDNSDLEQRNLNNSINNGSAAMSGLLSKVLKLATAYMGISKLIKMSDELALTQARLNLMNDGLQSTDDLFHLIYQSAQNARGSLFDMADVVARIGNNAKDAFSSSKEVVAFSELVQKQMTIAGASTQEASNAILQLSQALGSGVLRGDELNSIFEQAPNLIQSIADYLNVPIGQIKLLAQEGKLSSEIVKNAIFADTDNINNKFKEIPLTWGQVWRGMANTAVMIFKPILTVVNDIANSEMLKNMINTMVNALNVIASVAGKIIGMIGEIFSFIQKNWTVISPIILGIAAALALYSAALIVNNTLKSISAVITGIKTAADILQTRTTFMAMYAQYGLNTALLACPLTWIIMLVIAFVSILFVAANTIARLSEVATSGFGIIAGGINVVIQFFANLGMVVANITLGIGNAIGALCSNMMTAFKNAISSVKSWFFGLLSTALSTIAGIASALNKLPFVNLDISGIENAANNYAAKSMVENNNKQGYKSISGEFSRGFTAFDTFQSGWVNNAFKSGVNFGDGLSSKFSAKIEGLLKQGESSDMFPYNSEENSLFSNNVAEDFYGGGNIPQNISDIAKNTGKSTDILEKNTEDLKYIRELAQREVVVRYTTPNINIDLSKMKNNISNEMDIDGVIDAFVRKTQEAVFNI